MFIFGLCFQISHFGDYASYLSHYVKFMLANDWSGLISKTRLDNKIKILFGVLILD